MIQVANVAILMLHTVSFQHPWHPQLAQVTIGKVPRITTGVISLVGSLCLLSGFCLLGVVLRGGAEGTGGACGSEVGRGTLQDCGGGGVGADPVPAGKVVLTTVDRVFAGWLGNLTSVFPFEDEGVGVEGTSGGGGG